MRLTNALQLGWYGNVLASVQVHLLGVSTLSGRYERDNTLHVDVSSVAPRGDVEFSCDAPRRLYAWCAGVLQRWCVVHRRLLATRLCVSVRRKRDRRGWSVCEDPDLR